MVSEEMQATNAALLSSVVPHMDDLANAIETFLQQPGLHAAVKFAAECGSRVLEKYWSKTDESWMYRVAICMLLIPQAYTAFGF